MVFLQRKAYIGINLVGIGINLALALHEILYGHDSLVFRAIVIGYTVIVSVLWYLLTLKRLSIDRMLYAIYLGFTNLLVFCLVICLRVLFRFDAKHPYAILIANIPMMVVAQLALGTTIFLIIVRKYMVQGLTSPTSIQREKGIESAVMTVRSEYPEIFQ
ncbi:hypothetical protein NEHOM01_0418 [Nematocida homosporus]|uniref:uncharacterized protein n=1 Tax=Nematocida homosporus TaxID=1912981 RepID=UPI0022201520|nr:uncharacterized protein NEHOM01_0418 [Nematocida homosporus]KAI5184816.1 hypothetical protein NEHOM01_0418 [Nematocida homosporus]